MCCALLNAAPLSVVCCLPDIIFDDIRSCHSGGSPSQQMSRQIEAVCADADTAHHAALALLEVVLRGAAAGLDPAQQAQVGAHASVRCGA